MPGQLSVVAAQNAVLGKWLLRERVRRKIGHAQCFGADEAEQKPKNAEASPTGPASPASSTVPMRNRVAGSYRPGVTKTAMAVILATKMTGVLMSPVAMAASPMMSADTRLTE